jgi:hypothetical protein
MYLPGLNYFYSYQISVTKAVTPGSGTKPFLVQIVLMLSKSRELDSLSKPSFSPSGCQRLQPTSGRDTLKTPKRS